MSSAHRPTWNPAEGRADDRHKSARVGAQDLPAHTKLKFRQPQQGAQSTLANADVERRRDLKRELEAAEREHRNKKRRELGLAEEEEEQGEKQGGVAALEAPDSKDDRQKILEEAQELDADESHSESSSTSGDKEKG